MGLRSVRQPRNCHVLLMEASWPKATHYLTLTHSAAADSDSSASLCLNCKHEDEDDGRPYAPTPGLLPAACGAAGPHQFLHNGTRLVPPWTPLFLLEPSGQCLLLVAADMHSSDLAKAAHLQTFLRAQNLKGKACRQQRGLNTFQSQLTVLVTLLPDQSRYHPLHPPQYSCHNLWQRKLRYRSA